MKGAFKKDTLKHVVALAFIVIALFILWFNSDLSKRNSEATTLYNNAIHQLGGSDESLIALKEGVDSELNIKIEQNMRKQMRLNLEAVGKKLEIKINNMDFKNYSKEDIIKNIKHITFDDVSLQRTYNAEGDWFVLLTVGGYTYFLIDESNDCGEPTISGKRILSIPNRTRSIYDEVVWQEECKYILSLAGLIPYQTYMDTYNPLKINIDKFKSIDNKLKNVDVFRYKDLEYIKNKYPAIYDKMRDLKIILHSEPILAEKFMDFIAYNRSTVDSDNLYWYFNEEPRKEILEVYVVPSGMYGFNNTPRTMGAGVFNDNYIKLSLVAGAQLFDYETNEYKPILDKYNNILNKTKQEHDKFLEKLKVEKEKTIYYNSRNMIVISLIFILCVIFSVYSWIRIPENIVSDEFLDKYVCKKCDKKN